VNVELNGKRLEMLKEVIPGLSSVAVLAQAGSPTRVSGSNATKTYGKAHCQEETFPTKCFFGKVCARSHQPVKDLYRVASGAPRIVFGKVPDNITASV
jgi:hypothetical protein